MRKALGLALLPAMLCCLSACAETAATQDVATDPIVLVENDIRPDRAPILAADRSEGLTENTASPTQPDHYTVFGEILARHQRMSTRVSRISRALRVANAPLCDLTRDDLGLSTHRLDDYPETLRHLAMHYLSVGEEGRYVRSVVAGSPAEQAGVRAGDKIVSGWPLSEDRPLILDSGESLFRVSDGAQTACHIPTFVINDDRPNASTDGVEVDLTTALIEQVGDDSALAFIIAHEMVHVIRAHSAPSWAAELEADADALILMRNAGFDVAGTVAGWEAGVEAHRNTQSFSSTHPPIEIRLKNLRDAFAALEATDPGFLSLPAQD